MFKYAKKFSPPEENVKLEPNLQKGGNGFLYVESKRARLEREKVPDLFLSKYRILLHYNELK